MVVAMEEEEKKKIIELKVRLLVYGYGSRACEL